MLKASILKEGKVGATIEATVLVSHHPHQTDPKFYFEGKEGNFVVGRFIQQVMVDLGLEATHQNRKKFRIIIEPIGETTGEN